MKPSRTAALLTAAILTTAAQGTPSASATTPTPPTERATTLAQPTLRAPMEWWPNWYYVATERVTYQGSLYQCLLSHHSLPGQPPPGNLLWRKIG